MAFAQIVQDAADETFGPSARVHLTLREPHVLSAQLPIWVAWVGDNYDTVFAIGAGDTTDDAFRDLIRSIYADDHTVSAETVARILCINGQRVRQLVKTGRLVPISSGQSPNSARFAPIDVLRRAGLIRDYDAAYATDYADYVRAAYNAARLTERRWRAARLNKILADSDATPDTTPPRASVLAVDASGDASITV